MVQRKRVVIRFKYRTAFRALRTAPGVRAAVQERAQRIAQAAPEGVAVLPEIEPYSRARAIIGPTTAESARAVAADPASLLRAIDAGRGQG